MVKQNSVFLGDGDGEEAQKNDMSPSCSLVTDRSSRSDNSISGAAPALTPIFYLPRENDLLNPSA